MRVLDVSAEGIGVMDEMLSAAEVIQRAVQEQADVPEKARRVGAAVLTALNRAGWIVVDPNSDASREDGGCRWCGERHAMRRCPNVKAFEYGPDGKVTRVEFLTPNDYQPLPSGMNLRDLKIG